MAGGSEGWLETRRRQYVEREVGGDEGEWWVVKGGWREGGGKFQCWQRGIGFMVGGTGSSLGTAKKGAGQLIGR